MVNETNFIVRISGRKESSCYIDYLGVYKVNEIAKITGLKPSAVKEMYLSNGGSYDENLDIYYFKSVDDARKTISDILKDVKDGKKGRVVSLTEAEIEYIRRALINEQSNTIHVKNSIKDEIFKKLNG
mgnify:CR=1 FL=1